MQIVCAPPGNKIWFNSLGFRLAVGLSFSRWSYQNVWKCKEQLSIIMSFTKKVLIFRTEYYSYLVTILFTTLSGNVRTVRVSIRLPKPSYISEHRGIAGLLHCCCVKNLDVKHVLQTGAKVLPADTGRRQGSTQRRRSHYVLLLLLLYIVGAAVIWACARTRTAWLWFPGRDVRSGTHNRVRQPWLATYPLTATESTFHIIYILSLLPLECFYFHGSKTTLPKYFTPMGIHWKWSLLRGAFFTPIY